MTHLLLPSPLPLLIQRSSKPSILLHARRLGRIPNASSNGDPSSTASDAPPSESPPSNNSKPAGVKNRLRSRNQSRRVQLDAPPEELVVPQKKKASAPAPRRERQQPKKWEEMSLSEKALELYVGEKGLLFWLNKFAYASIFIMVGAWILFRFVGPSLGLYQLDAPPLPPTAVFGG